ncbi:MAG: histidine kinase [Niabella sp.]
MHARLVILLILLSYCADAQKPPPVAVANTYTLTEADGFPGYNYVNVWEHHPSGKIYAKDFFGNLHITGNNFMKPVRGFTNLSSETGVRLLHPGNGAIVYELPGKISVIKNDSLWKTVVSSKKLTSLAINFYNNRLYAFEITGKLLTLYEFKGEDWVAIGNAVLPAGVLPEHIRGDFFKDGKLAVSFSLPGGSRQFYEMDTTLHTLRYLNTLSRPQWAHYYPHLYNSSLQKDTALERSFSGLLTRRMGKALALTPTVFSGYFINMYSYNQYVFIYGKGLYEYFTVGSSRIQPQTILFESKDKLNSAWTNPAFPYIVFLTGNKPLRVFPYIKKYPHIYNNDNASNIFAVAQDDAGHIWAGSYQNQLSIIKTRQSPQLIMLKKQPYPFMNAALNYNGKIYLVGELSDGGVLQYDRLGNMRKLKPQLHTGYYLYYEPKNRQIYYATAEEGYPAYYCNAKDIEKPVVPWQKIDSAAGLGPIATRSITSDTLGRVWMGHPNNGFAVYSPSSKKAITYDMRKNESPIGFISSITDSRGTVWMGSDDQGLWYYNDYSKPPTPQNIHNASHPLLNNVKRITAMTVYKNWLVLGCYNRICLLNLDSFYQKKKIILRYLNPQEAALTSFTEQNTFLVSKTDSTLWFTTSDMLYQWDIKTWLQLPQYKVQMAAFLQRDSARIEISNQKKLRLKAGFNSFDIVFEYLSPDALPRFTRAALARQGDNPVFVEPGMQSSFSYQNLDGGAYTFYVEVFEQDGTISTYRYPFIISKYLWQHWWFWTVVSLLFLLPFVLWLNTRRKKALQDKEISQLNVVTLSSQFRPHFILNTLNAIGADLKDKPGAESIISRLGESINLIFNYAQQRKVNHSLKDEWTLIKNVIQIHRIIYLPELEVKYTGEELLETYKNTKLPLGILEINVENALLHGLRNKPSPPYTLTLQMSADTGNLYFTIADDGIGRRQSMSISSYKKHGTGTQNLRNIINILNRFNKDKIEMYYTGASQTGTEIKIKIPKIYHYEY